MASIHPHLWPAWIGTALGLVVIAGVLARYARGWRKSSQRRRWGAGVAIALFSAIYGLNVYAWLVEPRLLVVREIAIESAQWRGAPLRIVLVGDWHAGGPHVSAARIERVVGTVDTLAPDIVFLLGDYVGGHTPRPQRTAAENAAIDAGLAALARLEAPLGVVAVLGNHDDWYDRSTVTEALARAGIDVLVNGAVTRARAGHSFIVAGLDDAMTGTPDFARALSAAPALAAAPALDSIVLSHSPDPFVAMPRGPALMLAAHTHCGQVSIPFVGRPIVPSRFGERYACGAVEEDGQQLFVTGGLGTSILPVRFLNPPEVAVLTLRAAAAALPGPLPRSER